MAIDRLKIKPWGPPVFREIIGELQDAINERTPVPGFGINVDEREDGFQISTKLAQPPQTVKDPQGTGGGSASGTAGDIEGALNGAPATFHFLQGSPPTPRT
jgi:hypothetical protein